MDARMFTNGSVKQLQCLRWGLAISFFTLMTAQAAPVVVSVDHRVTVSYSKPQFDAKKSAYVTQVRIKNRSGASLQSPLQLSFDETALKNLRIQNAQGIGKDGRPYFEIKLPKGLLLAKASTKPVKVVIAVGKGKSTKRGIEKTLLAALSSAQHVSAGVEVAPLQPRTEPYALKVNSGRVNVRFSVMLVGPAKSASAVYLRHVGDRNVIAMNDKGKGGDLVPKDGVYGVSIVVDTNKLKPDSCQNYEAFLKLGRSEVVSIPYRLCASVFPVRVASSNEERQVELGGGVKAVSDEILVVVNANIGSEAVRRLASEIGADVVGSIPPLNLFQMKLRSPVSAGRLTELVSRLKRRAEVKAASFNAIGSLAYAPNDPEYPIQHGVQLVRADDVWDIGATGTGVTVIVLDSGLDRTHPDFGIPGDCQLATDAASGVADTNCGGTNNDSIAPSGHGTQVAGIITAKTNNGAGVAGVSYGSKTYSIKVTPDIPVADTEMIQGFTDAATYVSSHGEASVVNASFSTLNATYDWNAVCHAMDLLVTNGGFPRAVVINAAGNSGRNGNYYPARCNDLNANLGDKQLLITVANSTTTSSIDPMCANASDVDQRCGGTTIGVNNTSNYGSWVDIAAPGMQIRTTATGGGYISNTGTSFSAPMVAGAAAILKQCGVALGQIESKLRTGTVPAIPIVPVSFPDGSSAPRLDIYRVMASLNQTPSGVILTPSSVNENTNTAGGYEIGALTATDADTCDKYTYTINGGPDAAHFSIGGAQNNRLFLDDGLLDYETTQHDYSVTVRVTDFFGAFNDQPLIVAVTNLNDTAPVINSNGGSGSAAIDVAEGNTAVTTVAATDADNLGSLTYSISGADASRFSIDGATGVLSFNGAPDFEAPTDAGANNVYDVTVQVTDGANTDTQTLAVTVTNANDNPPVITSNGGGAAASISVVEGVTAVATVTATDADNLGGPTYSLAGADAARFSINSLGVLSFNSLPDFEAPVDAGADNIYNVTVQVSDGTNTDTQAISVTVTNANDNTPVISSNGGGAMASISILENTTAVTAVAAADADVGSSLSYSLVPGGDAIKFAIDSVNGALSFIVGPDFEAPTDGGANNIYDVTVQVTDGVNTDTQAIAVTVTNVSEPPTGNPVIQPPDTPANRIVGQVLNADTSLVFNPDSWTIFEYKWKLDGSGVGANSNSYTLVIADIGGFMSLCVDYTNNGGVTKVTLCSATDANAVGDPHMTTVDGLHYDFQSAGEFVALRDASGMELQVRQAPVSTAGPLADGYSGLPVGVSINTAIAASVGARRVTYQPNISGNPASSGLELRVDGVVTMLPADGLDLGSGGRVSPSGGGIQIDFPDHTTVIATPGWWSAHNVWYLNVSVFHTSAHEGIMGARANGSWLPRLSDGSVLGAMPVAMHDRYVELYEKFADSWRVNGQTSLFDYMPGTSTATFTFKEWPKENPPYVIGSGPVAKPVKRTVALRECRDIVGKNEKADCLFDVMVMGNPGVAKTHLLTQKVRAGATSVLVRVDKDALKPGESVVLTATVSRQAVITRQELGGRVVPTGAVQFTLDGKSFGVPVKLDAKGQVRLKVSRLKVGKQKIAARYIPSKGSVFMPSSSKQAARAFKPVGKEIRGVR